MRKATPACERMPTPTTETLAMSSSVLMPCSAISGSARRMSSTRALQIARAAR